MSSELITTWTEHHCALQKVLLLASKTLRIFDDDLSKFKLESRENSEILQHFLTAKQENSLCIVLKNSRPVRCQSPRLMALLRNHPHQMSIVECPLHLASANNSLCLADDRHALVRIHHDQARARLVIDSAPDCSIYLQQFEAIADEGGEPISVTTLGL